MDKNETKWLTVSLKLILIGIVFWVVKPRYLTHFILPEDNFLNAYGFELIGTILIMTGLVITRHVYPFFYTFFAEGFAVVVFVLNVLNFFLRDNEIFRQINCYDTFFMSLCLFFVSKLLENGLRYFGAPELARKWRYFAIIIFFGFTIPFYMTTTLFVCDLIQRESFVVTGKLIGLAIPFLITIISAVIFYVVYLVKSFGFLNQIQRENEDNK